MQSDKRHSDATPPEAGQVDKMPAIQSIALNTPPPTPSQVNTPTKPAMPSAKNILSDKPVACTRCKAKKIKCDGKTPSCSACTKAREQCLIADMVTGKAHPRGYIQHMQNRISELQSLIDTKTREARVLQSRQASTSSYVDSPLLSDPLTPAKRSSATSLPCQPAEPIPGPRVDDSEGDLALARLLVQTLHLKDHGPCISKLSYLISDDSSTSVQALAPYVELPSESESEKLIDLYIRNEHRCFPFLSEDEIYEIMGRVHSIGASVQDPTQQDLFRAFMIFAIGALSDVREETDPTATAFSYYNSALMYAGGLSMMSGIPAIQNLLLLCLFSLNAKITQDAWRLSRRALHIGIQEEFHLNIQRGNEITQSSRENIIQTRIKQNIFWSAYCLNRITSNMIYDRPPSIPEADIDIEVKAPTEADTTYMSMANGAQMFSRPTSLLPNLVRLYHLSTVAFTSFNSNPPGGDTITKLEQYFREFQASRSSVLQSPTDKYNLPHREMGYQQIYKISHSSIAPKHYPLWLLREPIRDNMQHHDYHSSSRSGHFL
ncbi:Transcriptional activator [Drechslerella dactyloides]|uniref:Transcriptional activator n=1 Tax=Drechslerella dactyloides TaxID=74499 RepID=A0AAD6IS95_DREDA|nr:Transcriptional activator [Drechslerella dactyloides]